MDSQLEIEMSISLKDFYRLLPIALKGYQYEINNSTIIINNGSIRINHGDEKSRSIASLKFPILNLHFSYSDINENHKISFMNNFRKVYQKGGG